MTSVLYPLIGRGHRQFYRILTRTGSAVVCEKQRRIGKSNGTLNFPGFSGSEFTDLLPFELAADQREPVFVTLTRQNRLP